MMQSFMFHVSSLMYDSCNIFSSLNLKFVTCNLKGLMEVLI